VRSRQLRARGVGQQLQTGGRAGVDGGLELELRLDIVTSFLRRAPRSLPRSPWRSSAVHSRAHGARVDAGDRARRADRRSGVASTPTTAKRGSLHSDHAPHRLALSSAR
jgi:hypothetical protein